MPPPNYVEAITSLLESTERFQFSAEARREIDSFFEDHIAERYKHGLVLEQSRALVYLSAAEYSLLPYFANPGNLPLAPAEVIAVSAGDARLALLKGSCTLAIWQHAPQDRVQLKSFSDLTVFGGDASKLTRATNIEPLDQTLSLPQIHEYVGHLSSVHTQSSWPPAVEVARSGAIERQGFLWALKAAVVQHTTEENFRSALVQAPEFLDRPEPA
jgi:hypothetical protein